MKLNARSTRAGALVRVAGLLLIAAGVSWGVALQAQAGPGAKTPYSWLTPKTVDGVHSAADTAAGKAIVAAATADLAMEPDAQARLHTEGTLPHQGIWDESVKAEQDFPRMRDLALAYRLTGDRKFLDAEIRYLTAWVDTYHVSLNPIDETKLDPVFLALDLTRSDLPASLEKKWEDFFRGMANGYLDYIANEKNEDTANWQSHRIKLVTLCAYGVGDEALVDRARTAFQRHMKVNLRPDGSVEDFYKRDALHYVTYDLEPLTAAALAAKAHGEDWFHYRAAGGPNLEMAVDWLTPYALGQKTHQEFVHSTVAFDAKRANAGLKEYSGAWDPKGSLMLYSQAASLEEKYRGVYQQVLSETGEKMPEWLQVLGW